MHTPGPWALSYDLVDKLYEVTDQHDHTVVHSIAWKPDARLIAAAPEMLEALKAVSDFSPGCSYCDSTGQGDALLSKIRSILRQLEDC